MRPDASTMLMALRHVLHAVAVVLDAARVQRKLVFAVPHHSAACRIAFSAMPVTSAVRCGVHSRTCSATASKPTVWSSMNA